MTESLFWLFNTPAGQATLGGVILVGVLCAAVALAQGNVIRKRAEAEAASREQMSRRDLVARAIERSDYIPMSEPDFRTWLDLNGAYIFPHEREAMVNARKAKADDKRPKERLHPYQN